MSLPAYLRVADRSVHLATLTDWLCLRAQFGAPLTLDVVPSRTEGAYDTVIRVGTYWDRMTAEGAASAARNATGLPAPESPHLAESTDPARDTKKEHDHA